MLDPLLFAGAARGDPQRDALRRPTHDLHPSAVGAETFFRAGLTIRKKCHPTDGRVGLKNCIYILRKIGRGSVDLGKLIFANSAERTYEIVGEILKGSSGSNAVFGIAYFRVINPITYFTYVFIHNFVS